MLLGILDVSIEAITLFAFLVILIWMFAVAWSFGKAKSRKEFEAISEGDRTINLNLNTLIWAYFFSRKEEHHRLYKRLAQIGFVHFAVFLFGVFLVFVMAGWIGFRWG